MNFPPALPPALDPTHRRRTAALAAVYAAVVCASFYVSYELRFDFAVPEQFQAERVRLLPLVVAIKLLGLVAGGQMGTLLTYFGIPDLVRLFWSLGGASFVLLIPRLAGWSPLTVPRGVLMADFLICFGAFCAGRVLLRVYRERLHGGRKLAKGEAPRALQRIAIIGAGDAGASLAKEFLSHPARGFRPVMFFDDDPHKHGKLMHGVPVVGRPEAFADAEGSEAIGKAVIAMPSASAKRIREIVALFVREGVSVETLPSLEELASGRVRASRIRPVEVQDLLGREAVDLDSAGIKHAVENQVVLVTGAGGSIGGELCRQIVALNPKRLLMVEQAEGALFLIEQELAEIGLGGVAVPLVADILDGERMQAVFTRYRPDIVFHAAAHKHVYLMERQPAEAIRNNVFGTRALAEIAVASGVRAFVLISTDKAINPTNVMGATKRLAELLLMRAGQDAAVPPTSRPGSGRPPQKTVGFQREAGVESSPSGIGFPAHPAAALAPVSLQGQLPSNPPPPGPQGAGEGARGPAGPLTKFMAVRFGNVLGSSGSVIPIFKRQISNGGPVTVTHPDVTRYFMTIPEAVGLVLQSFVLGKGGEIFVLDMGQPIKIVDLARQMIELSGFRVDEDIEIKFTGLKPGEKLFEELQHRNEEHEPTAHPRVMQFKSRHKAECDPALLRQLEEQLHQLDSNQLKLLLQRLVTEYQPYLD